jgi:protein ImuB
VCEALKSRGEGALAVTISFALANRSTLDHPIRAARATAGQTAWMRLVRLEIERIVFPDAVTGITLRVDAVAGTGGRQGDAFDRGFGSESAAEEALGQLMDDQGAVAVEPENSEHPLLDRRTAWTSVSTAHVMERAHRYAASLSRNGESALTLQLLPEPRRISVATFRRRGDEIPRAYRDNGGAYDIVEAAGPERVTGGRWDEAYARDYFRCVIEGGELIWLYRDARNVWYLHGWWD